MEHLIKKSKEQFATDFVNCNNVESLEQLKNNLSNYDFDVSELTKKRTLIKKAIWSFTL